MFKGVAYNEEVIRKFKLDQNSIEEVNLDIKFSPLNKGEVNYIHVVPRDFHNHLVEIKAELTLGSEPLKCVKISGIPASLHSTVEKAEALNEVYYKITIPEQEYSTGVLAFSLREIYKSRREPFPSTIKIRDD